MTQTMIPLSPRERENRRNGFGPKWYWKAVDKQRRALRHEDWKTKKARMESALQDYYAELGHTPDARTLKKPRDTTSDAPDEYLFEQSLDPRELDNLAQALEGIDDYCFHGKTATDMQTKDMYFTRIHDLLRDALHKAKGN